MARRVFCDHGSRVSEVGHGCVIGSMGGWESNMEICPSLGSSAHGHVITLISQALGPIYLKNPTRNIAPGQKPFKFELC